VIGHAIAVGERSHQGFPVAVRPVVETPAGCDFFVRSAYRLGRRPGKPREPTAPARWATCRCVTGRAHPNSPWVGPGERPASGATGSFVTRRRHGSCTAAPSGGC
jgi:hypothetical protein